ncbi:MAG: phosphate acetyltransferase [Candidatus Omnitrophica bacterium]|nr:phosphate acetyltransferase [Candidatus Omnitrophota bacterium]
MHDIVRIIREKAKVETKTIVLPESKDPRIQEAARIIEKEGIARILLLTPEDMDTESRQRYCEDFFNLRKDKGMTIERARQIISEPLYYAAMMVRNNAADGFVAGACYTTPEVARAAIYCLGTDPAIKIASSCFIMVFPDRTMGAGGVFVFADCGIIPQPDSQQLAYISISAAELAKEVLQISPRIALLSYSSKGSGKGEQVVKVREALKLIRQIKPELLVDGELQLDAAIVPQVAKAKKADAVLQGRANVLIFPELSSGNISYKLAQRLANARAIGPLILGLDHPCSDLSRGCLVEDIVDCVAVTAIRAQSLK